MNRGAKTSAVPFSKLCLWVLALSVLTLLLSVPVSAASFDCSNARTPTETAICGDSSLGRLDEQIAELYASLRSASVSSERSKLLKGQRRFLQNRNSCGESLSCLRNRYESRRADLCNLASVKRLDAAGTLCSNELSTMQSASTHEPFVIRGRCHMGGCGFTQVVSMREVRAGRNGSLIEVEERGGYVEAPIENDEPQWDKVKVPNFSGPTSKGWAFCSTRKPSVIFFSKETGTYYVDVIAPGYVEAIYGYNTSAHLSYWGICHNRLIDEAGLNDDRLNREASSMGYRRLGENIEGQFEFRSMSQVYDFLGL